MTSYIRFYTRLCALLLAVTAQIASANAYREKGKATTIGTGIVVIPFRDWNRLDLKPSKFAEIWTLDGEQLNEVTTFVGVEAGQPLFRERNKKREPLPKFRADTLLIEIPELLEATYRAYKKTGSFAMNASEPGRFLDRDGIHFSYTYADEDGLTRKGDACAVLIDQKLFMTTFDAPRLYYFDRTLPDYRALADAMRLTN